MKTGIYAKAPYGIIASGEEMMSPAESLAELFAQLDSPNFDVRNRALRTIEKRRDVPAIEALIALFEKRKYRWSQSIAYALGIMGDTRAVPVLLAALDDTEIGIRMAAASALGHLGDRRAVEPLIQRLDDSDSRVRRDAAYALATLGDERAFVPLVEKAGKNHPSVLAFALGMFGDTRGVVPLRAIITKYGGVKTKGEAAIWGLGMLGEADVLPDLLQMRQRGNSDPYEGLTVNQIDEAIAHIVDHQQAGKTEKD